MTDTTKEYTTEEYTKLFREEKKKIMEILEYNNFKIVNKHDEVLCRLNHTVGTGVSTDFTLQINDVRKISGVGSFFMHRSLTKQQVLELLSTIMTALEEYDKCEYCD